MSRRRVRHTILWLILGIVILGCATPALVTPHPAPVIDPGSVETIIVQTAGAAQTQTLQALPPTSTPTATPVITKTPTVSPTPTATFLFLFPTQTDLPDDFFGDDTDFGGGSGNEDDDKAKPAPQEWACRVLSKSPANEAVITGDSFRAIWTVKNTGTQTWPKKSVDIVYISGARLNQGKPYYDIPKAVPPGGTVTISVTMYVPRSKDYNTRWGLKIGRTEFCTVRFSFTVK